MAREGAAAAVSARRAPMRRSQRALIAAAVLGPMLLFAAVGWWSYERVQTEASTEIQRTVDILHEEGMRFFETERYLLQNVDAELLGLSWPEIVERRGRFNALLDGTAAQIPEVEAVFVGDADGTTQLSSRIAQLRGTGAATGINVRDRAYFEKAQAGASFIIDGPLKSRLSGETVIAIVHRLSSSDNAFRGVVVVNVDVDRLVRSWRTVTTPGNAISLVRDDGTILARYPPLPGVPALDPAAKQRFPRLLDANSGLFDAAPQAFDRIARRIGFRKLTPFPVYIIYAVAESNILKQWYPIAGAFGGIAAAASAGLLFASFAVIRRARGEATAFDRAEAAALALSESEEAHRALFRKAPTAMHALNADRRIIDVNERWLDLFGYRREEVIGRPIYDFYEAVDAAEREIRWHAIVAQGTLRDMPRRCIAAGGTRFDALVAATVERDPDGRFMRVITTVTDISLRRRAEEAARSAQRFAELLIESSADGIIIKDRNLRITTWNPPMEAITGRKLAEVLGRTAAEIFPEFYNEALERAWRDALEGRTTTLQDQYFEFSEPRRAGFFDETVAPLRDAEGAIVGALSTVRDTTERHRLEEVLRQSQKMEAVGQLTGGIAHDFNNLLTIILGNLETVQRRLPPRGDLYRFIDSAVRGAERAAMLTQRLLAFSRRQPLAPRPLDPNRLVGGMSDLLLRVIGERVAVETVLAGNIWHISADANQLESAILNLAVNARDAMPDGGKLTIETANVTFDEGASEADPELAGGQYVMIAVRDTGQGMTPEIRAHAFEPFFTTKETGRGSGLGLSQVYGFVKQSGGHVVLGSEPGEGTTVRLYLPRLPADADAEESAPARRSVPAAEDNEAILAVEDDEQVLEHTAQLLRELGYRVIEARDGSTALAALERERDVALLFTDVVLSGGLNGRQLADEALRRRPRLKVLFTTGYARDTISPDGTLEAGLQLIAKPFSYSGLAAKIRDVLSS